jgi:hypothetical protein
VDRTFEYFKACVGEVGWLEVPPDLVAYSV